MRETWVVYGITRFGKRYVVAVRYSERAAMEVYNRQIELFGGTVQFEVVKTNDLGK